MADSLTDPGLCSGCRFVRKVPSARGALFLRCGRSDVDPSFPKYPRLPVVACAGFDPVDASRSQAADDLDGARSR